MTTMETEFKMWENLKCMCWEEVALAQRGIK